MLGEDGSTIGRTYVRPCLPEQDPPGRDAVRYGAKYCNEAMEYGEASMKETRIECFRAGESTLSYCLPQVLRITCSGVLRTLICSYLDTGKERCLKIGKSYKMTKMRISGQQDTIAGHAA